MAGCLLVCGPFLLQKNLHRYIKAPGKLFRCIDGALPVSAQYFGHAILGHTVAQIGLIQPVLFHQMPKHFTWLSIRNLYVLIFIGFNLAGRDVQESVKSDIPIQKIKQTSELPLD